MRRYNTHCFQGTELFTPVIYKRALKKSTKAKSNKSSMTISKTRQKRPKSASDSRKNKNLEIVSIESTTMPSKSTTLSFNKSSLSQSDTVSFIRVSPTTPDTDSVEPDPVYSLCSTSCSECKERQRFLEQWSSLYSSSAEPALYDSDDWGEFDLGQFLFHCLRLQRSVGIN